GGEAAGAWVGCVQRRGLEITLQFAVPRVGSPFRNGIDDPSKRTAVFGFEAARFDLNFLDEVRLKVLANPTLLDIGDVDAVYHVDVLRVRGAVNLVAVQPAFSGPLQRFLPGSGCKWNHRLERAQLGNGFENSIGYGGLNFALRDVDDRRFSRNRHLLRDRADL